MSAELLVGIEMFSTTAIATQELQVLLGFLCYRTDPVTETRRRYLQVTVSSFVAELIPHLNNSLNS